jgi:hypothetical protein
MASGLASLLFSNPRARPTRLKDSKTLSTRNLLMLQIVAKKMYHPTHHPPGGLCVWQFAVPQMTIRNLNGRFPAGLEALLTSATYPWGECNDKRGRPSPGQLSRAWAYLLFSLAQHQDNHPEYLLSLLKVEKHRRTLPVRRNSKPLLTPNVDRPLNR